MSEDIITWENTTLYDFLYKYKYIPKGWEKFFADNKEILLSVSKKLEHEAKLGKKIYPPIHLTFRALSYFSPKDTKVVILGQDPYANGSAVGLCFSVKRGNVVNPSLKNIYAELKDEGYKPTENGVLVSWAKQGVLLLNTSLSVEADKIGSHLEFWNNISKKLIEFVSRESKCLFLMLGDKAIMYEKYVIGSHTILRSSHPSPLSANRASNASKRAFLGSNIFKECNEKLEKKINW